MTRVVSETLGGARMHASPALWFLYLDREVKRLWRIAVARTIIVLLATNTVLLVTAIHQLIFADWSIPAKFSLGCILSVLVILFGHGLASVYIHLGSRRARRMIAGAEDVHDVLATVRRLPFQTRERLIEAESGTFPGPFGEEGVFRAVWATPIIAPTGGLLFLFFVLPIGFSLQIMDDLLGWMMIEGTLCFVALLFFIRQFCSRMPVVARVSVNPRRVAITVCGRVYIGSFSRRQVEIYPTAGVVGCHWIVLRRRRFGAVIVQVGSGVADAVLSADLAALGAGSGRT